MNKKVVKGFQRTMIKIRNKGRRSGPGIYILYILHFVWSLARAALMHAGASPYTIQVAPVMTSILGLVHRTLAFSRSRYPATIAWNLSTMKLSTNRPWCLLISNKNVPGAISVSHMFPGIARYCYGG